MIKAQRQSPTRSSVLGTGWSGAGALTDAVVVRLGRVSPLLALLGGRDRRRSGKAGLGATPGLKGRGVSAGRLLLCMGGCGR